MVQVLGKAAAPSTARPGLGRKEGEEGAGQPPSPALSADSMDTAAGLIETEAKRQITPDIIKV